MSVVPMCSESSALFKQYLRELTATVLPLCSAMILVRISIALRWKPSAEKMYGSRKYGMNDSSTALRMRGASRA